MGYIHRLYEKLEGLSETISNRAVYPCLFERKLKITGSNLKLQPEKAANEMKETKYLTRHTDRSYYLLVTSVP
jgi:hypothetical protein